MATVNDVIRYVIEDIDSEIKILESTYDFALTKYNHNKSEKRSAMATGMDYLKASEQFDFSIGYYSSMAIEREDRIKILKSKRNTYLELANIYAEEAEQEEEGNE